MADGTDTQPEDLSDPGEDDANAAGSAAARASDPKRAGDKATQGSGGAGTGPQYPSASEPIDSVAQKDGVTFAMHPGETLATNQLTVMSNGPNFTGATGSISFWLEPNWAGTDQNNSYLVQVNTPGSDGNQVQILKNLRYLRFHLLDSQGHEHDVGFPIDGWTPGDRHYIAATWGEGHQDLYVDGGLAKGEDFTGQIEVPPGAPLYIGSNAPDSGTVPGNDGRVGNVKVYNRPLEPDEVANQIADGAAADSVP